MNRSHNFQHAGCAGKTKRYGINPSLVAKPKRIITHYKVAMRRNGAGKCEQLAAACFSEIVTVEIFQLVFAHVQRCVGSVVERDELAVTAGNFELANDKGGGTSRVSFTYVRDADYRDTS